MIEEDFRDWSALHDSCDQDFAKVERVLNSDVYDVNATTEDNVSVLHFAAALPSVRIVALFVACISMRSIAIIGRL